MKYANARAIAPPRSHILDISESWQRERSDLDLSYFLFAVHAVRLGRVLDDAVDSIYRRRFGISGSDMRVLFSLRRAGKPYIRRSTDLFRALLVTSGAITKQVDRLSRLGFVQRVDDPTLPAGVQLTAKGLRAANGATDALASLAPLTTMSKGEIEAGRKLIETILLEFEKNAPVKDIKSAGATKRHPLRNRTRS